jgi:phosphate transport system protein
LSPMLITRLQFESELEKLRNMLLEMGSEADRALADAVTALVERREDLADHVIERDDIIDEMDLRIEEDCMRLLALQQPIARDLRLVGTALKIITDLERIGDHSVDVAKVARKLAKMPRREPMADIAKMAMEVRQMLKTALDAFVRHDLDLVDKAVEADDVVDDLFHQIRSDLHERMKRDPDVVVEASYLLFVAHYLERMADHAVNIAERVHFVETGELAKLAKSHKG